MGLMTSRRPADCDSQEVIFVSADVARRHLGWRQVVERLRDAYSLPHTAQSAPPRATARTPDGWLRTQSASPAGCRFMGAKIFGIGPKRLVNYAIVLIEQDSGLLRAIVDGGAITAIRTAATSAVAIDSLAPQERLCVSLLGSGEEARAHLRAVAAIRAIKRAAVFSPTESRRRAFADEMSLELGIDVVAVASPEAAADCDILIAAARAREEKPIVQANMVRPGMLTVSIGSTLPEQREVDVSAVAACDLIVCDVVEEVLHETGDMLAARDAGIDLSSRLVSLNALMSGECAERVAGARQVMFKSVGSALQDVVVAELAFDCAVADGSANALPVSFYTKRP